MEVDPGNAIAMRFQNSRDRGSIGDVGRAFIMDHEVVAAGVIRVAQDGQRGMSAFIVRVDLIDDGMGAFLEALLQKVLLLGIIVAAAPGDEEDTKRLGSRQRRTGRRW